MKIYAPEYYKGFVCIADKCKHSCCVGWEIDIDEAAMNKYIGYNGEYRNEIIKSIDHSGEPHFRLDENERCPHLDTRGLCKIILNAGEDYLCHICREHPRFYNQTSRGLEVGIGMACEEACRIILESDSYTNICEIGECDGEKCEENYDTFDEISGIYEILCCENASLNEKIMQLSREYGVYVDLICDSEWLKIIENFEYLYASHKELFSVFSSEAKVPEKLEKKLERALAYFVYRHCSEVWDEDDFRVSLGFCLFCEKLLGSMCASHHDTDISELARILSEEIEYSEENTEIIKNVFYMNDKKES